MDLLYDTSSLIHLEGPFESACFWKWQQGPFLFSETKILNGLLIREKIVFSSTAVPKVVLVYHVTMDGVEVCFSKFLQRIQESERNEII